MTTLDDIETVSTASGAVTLQEAVEFIWREAELLDRHDYDAWLSLWSDAGLYIIPIDRDGGDPAGRLNVAYDDAEMRRARVRRLESGFSISSAPAARTVRTVSRFVAGESHAGGIRVRCAQHLVEYKFERTRLLAADVTYHLAREGDAIRIDRKEVLLANSDDSLWGIGYLL